MIPVHVAIDLEALSKRPNAVVLSVGLAAFTVQGGLVGTFYTEPSKSQQRTMFRDEDPDTVAWWNLQSDDARKVLAGDGIPVADSLRSIGAFLNRFQGGSYELAGVWGFGSDFDNAMLQDLYRSFGVPVPWHYKVNRCGRTVGALAGMPHVGKVGTHHNALDDAMFQAELIRLSLLKLDPTYNRSFVS